MNIYDSFIDGILELPDERDQKDALWALMIYVKTGQQPGSVRPVAGAWLTTVRPLLETSRARSAAGSKGGSKRQANAKQNASKAEANAEAKGQAKNKNKNISNTDVLDIRQTRFTPPTVSQVREYATERGHTSFDADKFVDYYTSNGWKVGRNSMKDWRAAVRNWARKDQPKGGSDAEPSEYSLSSW